MDKALDRNAGYTGLMDKKGVSCLPHHVLESLLAVATVVPNKFFHVGDDILDLGDVSMIHGRVS